ncbi:MULTISPECIES: TPM domain-containing protein [Flavobacterium]|uniref:TPM domain-containing protein n=1 Tax=Flavobacterium jumunjinense TaxID=998845 RepID=A0ABV5GS65_9FLAO|nr:MULTISPECIES: TPM domain-containing protein [Flavobacterium]
MTNLIFKIIKFLLGITLLLMHFVGFSQYDIPEKPSSQTSVYDYAGVLSESEKAQLENKLVKFSDSTTTQIVIVTINDLKGEDIGLLTPNWAQKWGIGQADTDNGILVLLSKKDRKIWISPGYGLEHKLTAGINGELIRNVIIPEFKAGSYYNGLDKGTTAIFEVIKGTYKGERKRNSKGSNFPIFIFILFFIILIILISRNKNNRGGGSGGRHGGPDLMDIIILSSLGRGSGGGSFGGGSSGGGFGGGGFGGGFGGGGFSGGGAGGSW